MDKEQWKNDVMDSLHGIRRAEPNPFLFTRIEASISRKLNEVTPRQWRIVTAASLILLILNGWFALRSDNGSAQRSPYQFNNHRYELY